MGNVLSKKASSKPKVTMATTPNRLRLLLLLTMMLAFVSCYQPNCTVSLSNGFELLQQTYKSIMGGLLFMDQVKSHLTLDALLGVVIVKEQSASMLRILTNNEAHSKHSFQLQPIKQLLTDLHKQSRQVASAGMPHIFKQDPHYFRDVGGILHGTIWSKVSCHTKSFKRSKSSQHQQLRPVNFTLNESVSDFCLSEVLNHCKISAFCWALFTEAEYEEYPLAHQVLYLTTAKSMNCLSKMPPLEVTKVEHKIASLCASMYKWNLKTEGEHYPQENQDLFMQNIAFCGLNNGFEPFRERHRWLLEIMSWQSVPKGCFAVDLRKLALLMAGQRRPAKRRERVFRQDGCSLHKTSMALASLSVYMQQLIVHWLRHSHLECETPN